MLGGCILAIGSLTAREDAALVGRHHVLDVDEGVGSAAVLEQLQGVLDDIADALAAVRVDALAQIHVHILVEVAHGQQLAIEGNQGLSHARTWKVAEITLNERIE